MQTKKSVDKRHSLKSFGSGKPEELTARLMYASDKPSAREKCSYRTLAYIAVLVIVAMTTACVIMPTLTTLLRHGGWFHTQPSAHDAHRANPCTAQDTCSITLVESIPENLTFAEGSPSHLSTFDAWCRLIDAANTSIDIASFYWTLRGKDVNSSDPSAAQGETIYAKLLSAVRDRRIRLRIAQNLPGPTSTDTDTQELAQAGAEVRSLNFTEWFGSGVLHTKFWIVDGLHLYVGSANMDWRALTQVKELGAVLGPCPCLVADAAKLFDVYWYLGKPHTPVPDHWPNDLATQYNSDTPMRMKLNDTNALTYLSSSPQPFCPQGRTVDIDAIVGIIERAKKYIYIAVMDYAPAIVFSSPRRFWPVIDDALRRASMERGVHVLLLASHWNHSAPALPKYLRSLSALNGALAARIQAKLFVVPAFTPAQAQIPFGRVNHNKYMVTDNAAYIGTSNWSGDYFVTTAGVGLIVNETGSATPPPTSGGATVQQQLTAIFLRDWNSTYAKPVHPLEGKDD